MRPSPPGIFVAFWLVSWIACAEVPKSLVELDVAARDFPQAAEKLLKSPKAEALSLEDSFYLLGATVPPTFASYEEEKEVRETWAATRRDVRALAWRKAKAAGPQAVAAYVDRCQRETSGRYPQRQGPGSPVLTGADRSNAVPRFAWSEAREWLLLDELERAVAEVKATPPRLQLADPSPLPEDLRRDVPKELIPALETFSRVTAPCFAANPSARPNFYGISNFDFDWKLMRTALSAGVEKAAIERQKTIEAMGFTCGTRNWPDLPILGETPMLTKMLKEQRWGEAAGYALLMDPTSNSVEGSDRTAALTYDLLEILLPQWEEAALGKAVLEQSLAKRVPHVSLSGVRSWLQHVTAPNVVQGYLQSLRWSQSLKPFASDKSVVELLDLAKLPSGKLVERMLRAKPLPDDLRRLIIADFASAMPKDAPVEWLGYGIEVLAHVDAPESRALLRKYLKHPSATVANNAASALKSFGENAPGRAEEPPLTIRVTLDKVPMRNRSISWARQYLRGNQLTSSDNEFGITDENGEVRIPRDYFHTASSWQVKGPSAFIVSLPGAWHDREIGRHEINLGFASKFPPDFGKPMELSATTIRPRFTIAPDSNKKLPSGSQVEIELRRAKVEGVRALGSPAPFTFKRPIEAMQLPPTQAGEWEVTLRAPGAAVWRKVVNISAESEAVEVQLDVGTNVVVGFAQKPEQNLLTSLLTSCLELTREGKRVELEWETYASGDKEHRTQALPAGKYMLRLPSSDELAQKLKSFGAENTRFRSEEKAFTISSSTGTRLELGSFSLSP